MISTILILTDDIGNVRHFLENRHATPLNAGYVIWRLTVPLAYMAEDVTFTSGDSALDSGPVYTTVDLEIHVHRPIDLLNHRFRGRQYDAIIADRIDYARLQQIPPGAGRDIRDAIANMVRGDEERLVGGFI